MATTDTTGLVQNNDFSAELLLNKVMNKQYRTQNGNTLTLTGRLNAANLDSRAQNFGVQAETIAKGAVLADATQDALTEILALTKDIQNNANLSDTAALKNLATEYSNQLSSLLGTTVDDTQVITGSKAVDLGLSSGSVKVGLGASTILADVKTALASMSAGTTVDPTTLDNALSQINAAIATEGAKAQALHNRYETLNDLASSYLQASNNQVVTEGGSATSLLNTLL